MTAAATLTGMASGFADPTHDSQTTFRCLMDAMARPGRVVDLDVQLSPPVAGWEAAGAIALTVLDFETPAWVPAGAEGDVLATWLRFHCGYPVTSDTTEAAFAFARAEALPPLADFNPGEAKYPERSTTLVVLCPALVGGKQVLLAGPGIPAPLAIAPAGLSPDFWAAVIADRQRFQLGIDLVLACGQQIIGLPRSTRISVCAPEGE